MDVAAIIPTILSHCFGLWGELSAIPNEAGLQMPETEAAPSKLVTDMARTVAFDHANAAAKTHRLLEKVLTRIADQDALLAHIIKRIDTMAADVDARFAAIVADVQAQTTVVAGIQSFLNSLQAEVSNLTAELNTGNLTDAQEQALTDFDNALKANTTALSSALTANTPGGTAAPVQSSTGGSATAPTATTTTTANPPAEATPTGPEGAPATVAPAGA